MNKYLNIFDYKNKKYPFQFFIGGRGTGKTYSALNGVLNGEITGKFIYMRRTKDELDLIIDSPKKGEGVNPFKPINKALNKNVGFSSINDKVAGVYNREFDDENKMIPTGELLGYGLSLSTIASIRGLDFSDVSDWVYDEFIPENHVKRMKDEGGALLNAYETICRNRELNGENPVFLWCLANSNNIYNPIFIDLGIVSIVEKMINKNQDHYYNEERGLAIHIIQNNKEFTNEKSNTALYRLTAGTQFSDMALENKFSYNDFSLIGYRKLDGYRPICELDFCTLYEKKGENEIYCSYAKSKCKKYNTKTIQGKRAFYRDIGVELLPIFTYGKLSFETYEIKEKILELIL